MLASRDEVQPAQDRSSAVVAVVVMAKLPGAAGVKTRLRAALSQDERSSLYAAMLADRCEQVRRLQAVIPAIAFADQEAHTVPAEHVPEGFEVVPQTRPGLGAGLSEAATWFLERGGPVVLVDSDSPTMPLAHLEEAIARLRSGVELVLGPAEDGGYSLIGLRSAQPELFRDIPWSGPRVLATTLERARARALRVHLLPTWWDVDTPEDLERLRKCLLERWWPAQTAEWLRAHPRRPPRPRPSQQPDPQAAVGTAARSGDALWETPWQTLSSREVYATRWLRLREDAVCMPDGRPSTYSVVACGACVGVLPFLDAQTVLMVRQYRYIAGRVTWEMPTGGVDRGESPGEAAARELAEEAGVRAADLQPLGAYHTSKSVMQETAHLYLARRLSPVRAQPDDTEFLRAEPMPFDRVLELVRSGEIVDSMTIIAVLRAEAERGA